MGLKIVSFPLYGKSPRYLNGALENAKLMPRIYPGWQMRVFAADDVDTTDLEALGCVIERMGISHLHSGMLWRFLPAWLEGVERVIFRDADSRIGPRESAAVMEWENSGLDAHCMHDHPHHQSLYLMSGMMGVKGNILPNIMYPWTRYMSHLERGTSDLHLLRLYIWPHIKNSLMRHSSVPVEWEHLPFPAHKSWRGFVGQQFDDGGKAVWPKI